jgi:inhibitor of KinA sporulation pathway (predicted exonuclease)
MQGVEGGDNKIAKKMTTEDYYLVIDLEATCDEGHRIPRERTEIIEIGAVLVDANSLQIVDELQTFVKPLIHPVLTAFCTELTSITQGQVEKAPTFPLAIERLRAFIGETPAKFCSWGDYDKHQFAREAERNRVTLPFTYGHLNLKQAFSERLGEARRYGLGQALRRAGLRFEGTAHRGIDDARNIARLLPFILGAD